MGLYKLFSLYSLIFKSAGISMLYFILFILLSFSVAILGCIYDTIFGFKNKIFCEIIGCKQGEDLLRRPRICIRCGKEIFFSRRKYYYENTDK